MFPRTNDIFRRIDRGFQHTSGSVLQELHRSLHHLVPVKFQIVDYIHDLLIIMKPMICPLLQLRDKILDTLAETGKCPGKLRNQPEHDNCKKPDHTGKNDQKTDPSGIFSFYIFSGNFLSVN